MGTLTVTGYASKEVPMDMMELTIDFQSENIKRSKTTGEVMGQANRFLEICKKNDIPTELFTVDEMTSGKISQDKNTVTSNYKLLMKAPINIGYANAIIEILKKNDFDAVYRIYFYLDDREDYNKLLTLEAIRNAKEEAEKIAASIGMKITGIEKAGIDFGDFYDDLKSYGDVGDVILPESSYTNLNQLKPTPMLLSKSMKVMWTIEPCEP